MSISKAFRIFVILMFVALGGIVSFAVSGGRFSFERLIANVVNAEKTASDKTEKSPESQPKKEFSDNEKKASDPIGSEGKILFGRTNAEVIFGVGETENSIQKPRIYTRDPHTSAVSTELTDIEEYEPSYSPDGTKIVFVSRRDKRPFTGGEFYQRDREIYIMNSDGTSQQRLTFNDAAESYPTFSPDGTKILYIGSVNSDKFTTPGIYSMNSDGTNQQLIVDQGDFDDVTCPSTLFENKSQKPETASYYPGFLTFLSPNYAPDGSKIMFGINRKVFTINPDGTGCSLFYESPESTPTEPQYSPDGTKVALFNLVYDEGNQIRTIKFLSSTGAPITELPIDYYAQTPVWSPTGDKIAFINQTFSTPASIDTIDIATGARTAIFTPEANFPLLPNFHGLSWEIPATAVPPISLKINEPHPVSGGSSTTATINLAAAPTADATVNLSVIGEANLVTLPQTNVVIPAGQTQATFQINTLSGTTQYKSADIIAALDSLSTRATVTVSPTTADLQAVSFTAPASFVPGQQISVSWTVQNVGSVSTGTGYSDYVLFSTDNVFDDNDTIVAVNSQAALAAGASRTTPRNLSIPASAVPQSGAFYLIFATNLYQGVNESGNTANNFIVRTIQANLPDVIAENIVAPAEIEPGVSNNIQWTVRNQGTANAGSFLNELYFSTDNIAGNADDVYIDYVFAPPLAPGASVNQNLFARIPTVPARPTGEAFFYVRVDVSNDVPEGTAGNANNNTFKSVQFNYNVADLQVSSTTAPIEVDSDTPFALEWTDFNAGNRNAPGFNDRVYFSLDNQVGGDVEIGWFPLAGGLNANSTAERIQNVTIPTNALPQTGNYFVYVVTDTDNNVDEGEMENNNIRFHPVRVRRLLRPDLTVTNITAPNAAFFDQTIQVQWTVTNSGQGPTNSPQWRDTVFLHTAPTDNGAYFVAQASSITALNAGESYIASATFRIPRGYNGTYYFTVKTDTDGALNEENRNNNTLTRPIQINVPPLPDLIVENVQVPVSEAFGGQELLVSYTIKNQGTAATGGFRDRVYLSRDTTLNFSEDRLIFTGDGYDSGTIAPNQSKTLTTRNHNEGSYDPPTFSTMRLPSDASGLWYVFVVTDYRDDIYEFTNENNNTNYDSVQPGAPLNILVTPPDLVVENLITAPNSAISGRAFQVGFTVKNQGAFNAAPFLYHAVYLSTDQTFDSGDTLLGSVRDENFFPPGSEHPFTTNMGLPNCLANGTYYLFAVADWGNRQFELDPKFDAEANNASPPKAIQITTVPPDLFVPNVQFTPITQPGQSVTVNWQVSNIGTGAASGIWYDYLILRSTNPQIPQQTLLSVQRPGELAAGSNYTQTRTLTLPAYMQGEYYFSVITDLEGNVPECGASENNNQGNSTNFTVQNNLPDLVIDMITAPMSAVVGDSFNVEWTGRNANGAMPANSTSWSDQVFLSTDQNLSFGDIYIGGAINNSILSSNQIYQKQAQVSTGNIPPGTYYILVAADAGGNIYEGASNSTQENNNARASGAITLTTPSVDLQASNVSVAAPFYSGTDLTISWTVTNFGTSPTLRPDWSDYVILSRDGIVDQSDRILGYLPHNGILAGGASYNVSSTFPIPNGLTGDYRIFVVTDYNNWIIEDNNANNTSLPFALDFVLPPPADLNVTNISPPVSVNLGENATFNWTVQNSGANPVLGTWRDTVYLSRDPFWDSSDILVAQHDLYSSSTPVPAGGTYTTGTSFKLASVEEGTYYVIVRTDAQNRIRETNEANNVSNATAITTVTITELPINTPFNTTLENGGLKFFKFTPQPLETILMSLTTDTPSRSNELLTNFGTIVSRADFDFQGTRPGEGNQTNVIPETENGTYFSLVRTDFIPESFAENFDKKPAQNVGGIPPQNITVTAQVLPFSIQSISPEAAGNEGFSTLIIEGAKFQTGATVKLVSGKNNEIQPVMHRVSTSKISALFDLKGKSIGDYDVIVTNPGGATARLNDGFTIQNGGGHSLRESVVGPRSFYSQTLANPHYTISASNDGLNDALNVPVVISIPQINYTLDRRNIFDLQTPAVPDAPTPLPTHYDIEGRRYIFLFIPILRSKTTINFGIDLHIPPLYSDLKLQAVVLPPLGEIIASGLETSTPQEVTQRSVVPTADTAGIDCLAEFSRALGFFILKEIVGNYLENTTECARLALGTFLTVSDLVTGASLANMSGSQTDATGGAFIGAGVILDFISRIASSGAFECAKTTAENVFPWYRVASLTLTTLQLLKQLYDCMNLLGIEYVIKGFSSYDPNEKIAPEGYGAEHFVPVRQPMYYRINFENLSTATAPAQKIFISDELPPTLDPRTVKLKEIGFKQNLYQVPDNQAFYQQRVQLGADLNNLKADLVAGLDIINRRIFWTLTAIDPQTGEQPSDPLIGLLPPNNDNGDGNGFVTFTVEPVATMPTRTVINNRATIIFDANEPIVTNTTANLLDSGIPTSVLGTLPATSDVPTISINWSGNDDETGSGLKGFDVLFSESGNAYAPLLLNSSNTNGVFNLKWGKSYRFYSIARDNAGNIELAPNQPDATVRIRGGDTEADVAPRPDGDDGQVSADDTAQIRRFVAGLDTDFQFNEIQRADTAPLADGGDGALSVADVMQASRFMLGLDAKREAAGPNDFGSFNPISKAGNNNNLLPREIRPVAVSRIGNKITLAVELESQSDETGIGFTLLYNTAHLSNPANITLGNDASDANLTVNTSQTANGKLGILIDKAPTAPFAAGARQIVRIEFNVAANAPASTPIDFDDSIVKREIVDGTTVGLTTTFSSRQVQLLAPTAANVTVGGRVIKPNGAGIGSALVRITDSSGITRSVRTNNLGNFRFQEISAGGTYIISISAKGYEFTPQILQISNDVADLVFASQTDN